MVLVVTIAQARLLLITTTKLEGYSGNYSNWVVKVYLKVYIYGELGSSSSPCEQFVS